MDTFNSGSVDPNGRSIVNGLCVCSLFYTGYSVAEPAC